MAYSRVVQQRGICVYGHLCLLVFGRIRSYAVMCRLPPPFLRGPEAAQPAPSLGFCAPALVRRGLPQAL